MPKPVLIVYEATKAVIQNFVKYGVAMEQKSLRVNCVAPGSIWTPFILSTCPGTDVMEFGKYVLLNQIRQPAELVAACVLLASEGCRYITGATIQVTGGTLEI